MSSWLKRRPVAGCVGLASCLAVGAFGPAAAAIAEVDAKANETEEVGLIDAEKDLISLHYDHAPDKDDGQSAAADRMILESMFGLAWVKAHALAVSGAYGKNAGRFNDKSDAVMDACWNAAGGWVDAHADREAAMEKLAARWAKTLEAGGDIWVKEGGQSDLTADVVRRLAGSMEDLETTERIHVVQHSNWNENATTDADLDYVKKHTDYIRIKDANRYLNRRGGDDAFEKAATDHPTFGKAWQAAFGYYPPRHRLDFSDTGELLHMLGLGEMSIEAIRERFLDNAEAER